MPENNTTQPKTRQQRIEEFLLNPQKATFESLEQFESAVNELLDIFSAINIEALETLEGEDGKTPVRGVDYMNEEDFKALEDFILSKIPKLGVDVPSRAQVENFIKAEIAKIPRIKGDDGKSLKFSDLTEAQKAELRGKDGSSDTGLEILAKLRALPKNQRLAISDVRGLENVVKGIIDSIDGLDESVKKALGEMKFVVPANAGGEGGDGGGLTSSQIRDLVGAMFTEASHTGCSVDYDDEAGTLTITVSGGGGGGLTEEEVEDVVNGLLVAGTGITLTYNDGANTLTVALSGESFTTAMKTKVDHISVTQAVNLDTMESDILSAKTKTDHITVTQPVDLDAIESRVNALDAAVVLKGTWDASAGTFPGSGSAQAGDSYIVSVGGTVGGVVFTANDRILAIVDNASTGTYAANWHKLDYTDAVLSVDSSTGAIDLATILFAKTAKTTPVDADTMPMTDSAASNVLKKVTWANIKATLKTYLDTLYQPLDSDLTTIAGLTATTNNFIVSVGSAWASRTPAQVKTTLSLDNVDNTSNATERAATATLTNKRITQRVGTTASSSTPTPDADANDMYTVTALAAGATFGAPTGTPTNGQRLVIRIKDNGTARTLAFNAIYRAIGITLPTTTVISKTIYLGMIYNSADTKWDVIAYALEA
jgi:hypothetical protein